MSRRLSRKAKDLVCMRQFGRCGYCGRALCEAFEVDHINENRRDDRECNLVATCALCHAIKSRSVRMRRDWSDMRDSLVTYLSCYYSQWLSGLGWAEVPAWLRARLCCYDAYVYQQSVLQPRRPPLDLERYRYKKVPARRCSSQ